MGMGISALVTINTLRSRNILPARGSIIEMGSQQLANELFRHREVLEDSRVRFNVAPGYPFPEASKVTVAHGIHEHLPADSPNAKLFWEWVGYDYACVDIDDSPGAIRLDLNFDSVPESLKGKFDVVTNFGTTEHVANQLNAFKIIHDLVKPGGLMIHELPAQGFTNHGLVNYNPKFFWLLARSNGYKYVHMDFWSDENNYPLPENIIKHMSGFSDNAASRLASAKIVDCSIKAVLRKAHDIDFVPPIDVPSGIRTNDEKMKERYWTVFNPGTFEPLPVRLYRRLRGLTPQWVLRIMRALLPSGLYRRLREIIPYS
jgi:SAM-dependent methyltransferase